MTHGALLLAAVTSWIFDSWMMNDAMPRYRLWWLQQNEAPKEPPVTDEELIKLCRCTDWNSPGAKQLMRLIITLSRSGL